MEEIGFARTYSLFLVQHFEGADEGTRWGNFIKDLEALPENLRSLELMITYSLMATKKSWIIINREGYKI